MGTEIELKLSLPRAALPALRRHPLLIDAPRAGPTRTLDNCYYDTPDLDLQRHGIALRTRRHGRRWWQTVKCAAPSTGGLSQRPEWEQPFLAAFDFSAIDDAAVAKRLARHRDDLVPLFSTRFRRETRVHQPDADTRILVMIDTGELVCDEAREGICELELELAAGTPLDLLHFARQLAETLPLLPLDTSKAERGYRLFAGLAPSPAKTAPSPLDPGQSPVEAFRALAAGGLRHWQANVAGAAAGDDPEFVHQLRVSQRRLRSLIALFAPALPAGMVSQWRALLRDNAASVGDTRDLDVLADQIIAPVEGVTDAEIAALGRLAARIASAREAARSEGRGALDSARQGRLLLDFAIALDTLPTNNLIGAVDLGAFARLQLDVVAKRVAKRLRAARGLEPAPLHALRIALKQLRYNLEFLAPLLAGKPLARYLKVMARAQDALGFIHDLDVARERLALEAGDDAALQRATAFVCGWHGPRYQRLCRRAVDDLRALFKAPAPWQS